MNFLYSVPNQVAVSPESSSAALLRTDGVDSALQVMSKDATLKDPSANLLTRASQAVCSEDIDLSFLTEAYPKHWNENDASVNLNSPLESSHEIGSTEGDTVMIDVSQPIQLSENSLIVVNGQKCVLQHDPRTGQVVAYPVREQNRPRRRRGRPRKISVEPACDPSEKSPPQETEHLSEEEREKGLLEVFNDDGSWVRRSSRKRKKAKTLKDYETGSLQRELGSDVDNAEEADGATASNRRRKQRGPGRPRKYNTHSSEHSATKEEEEEGSQAFLVQTADGQTLMLQVPLSSIPEGTTLQEVAHHIATTITTAQASGAEKKSGEVLQDHSIGSTTTTTTTSTTLLINEEEEEDLMGEEITLECEKSLSDITPGEEGGGHPLTESMEDTFCLDVSSTTASTSVDAPLLGPFNEHLINDHSFYVMKPPGEEEGVSSKLPAGVEGENAADGAPLGSSGSLSKKKSILVPAEIPPGPQKCKICAVPYATEEEIVEHFKAKHPKCICLECNYTNEHPYSIKRHSYRHTNEECVCHICHKKYKDSYILKMHVKMVHLPPEVLFRCDVCSKEFTRKAHLKRHQRIHAPLRQYPCPLCDYHGCERSDVTKHLLIHEEPKFKCEFCGKAFRHLKNKELHVKRHSGQRDYKCAACNFYGYTYTDIRKHIERRHSAVCHLCKQVFANPELCKEHKRLGLCQSSLLEAAKIGECPPPTLDDKKEIVLFGEVALDI